MSLAEAATIWNFPVNLYTPGCLELAPCLWAACLGEGAGVLRPSRLAGPSAWRSGDFRGPNLFGSQRRPWPLAHP